MLFCRAWGSALGRAGRKRKRGRRHPSGQLVRVDKRPDDRIRTSRQPHRRTVHDEDRLSAEAESPLGRLALRGVIDADALAAGERYAVVVGQYRSTIETPRATGGAGHGFRCEVEWSGRASACLAEPEACACLQRRNTYQRAYEALMQAGRRAVLAVGRVAIHREELARQDIVYLDRGLHALAAHFGLTGRRSREHSDNAH